MSHLHERNDRDVTDPGSYNLNDRTVFKRQVDELNPPLIEEFRSNGGKVGGQYAGMPLLLLHTIGAKSHQPRVNPLEYMRDGDAFVIVASKGGAPTNPDWYYNVLAHPEVELEVGTERFKAHATIPEREERDRLFANVVMKQEPRFGEAQKNTSRLLPVILLQRI